MDRFSGRIRKIWVMFIAFPLMAAACGAGTGAGKPTEVLPAYVFAQCTLMGGEARVNAPVGRPLIVLWGWTSATPEQMQAYRKAATVTVRLDGRLLAGSPSGDIQYDEAAMEYRAIWSAEAGIPGAGTHELTYRVEFSAPVSDGRMEYGPGSGREGLSDYCEILVR